MKLSLSIPISPTEPFVSRLHWLRRSLDQFGEPYSNAKLHLSVSRDGTGCPHETLLSFTEIQENQDRYVIHPVDAVRFSQYHYLETGSYRYNVLDDSDITIFCDADVMFMSKFDELLHRASTEGELLGVLARGSPFNQRTTQQKHSISPLSNDQWWNLIFHKFLGIASPLSHRYIRQSSLRCPLYFNAGFVVASTMVWKSLAAYAYQMLDKLVTEMRARQNLECTMTIQYIFQIALTLAIYKLGIPSHNISPMYNAWNSSSFIEATSIRPSEVKVLHYFGDPLINFYKSVPFDIMIDRVRREPQLDSLSRLLIARVDQLSALDVVS